MAFDPNYSFKDPISPNLQNGLYVPAPPVVIPTPSGVTQFRTDFPEFANPLVYPDSLVNRWLTFAATQMNQQRWGNLYQEGLELFTAHNLTLAQQRVADAANGDAPGAGGQITSMRVDKVAIAYNTTGGNIDGAGAWNLTTYGVMYYQLLLQVGSGGVQISGPPSAFDIDGPGFGSPFPAAPLDYF